jgi:hypothetical protein
MPTEHFKSAEAYRKSRAYTHIHGIPTHAKDVVVAGKKHKVHHGKKKKASTAKKTGSAVKKGRGKKHTNRKRVSR